jgi:lysine decarboxylase
MLVIVDEAHGTHFYFGEDMPLSAMDAGADISAISVHKTGGSLTQSSMLLIGDKVDAEAMRQTINLTQTTSGSYLLMISLDIARKNLFLNGKEIFKKVSAFAEYARAEINKIGGFKAFSSEIINGDTAFAFDKTKLSIHTRAMGLAGIEVYDLLRDEFGIQIEFGDIGNILAIISVGDRELEIERLLGALSEIYRRFRKKPMNMLEHEYIEPILVTSPQKAFYAAKRTFPIEKCAGRVSAELIMAYPPGIPILAPGELITNEIIEYVRYAKEKGCAMMGTRDITMKNIETLEE